VFDSGTSSRDIDDVEHYYIPIAILLISRYSDTLAVIKKESNKHIQYVGNSYSEKISLSNGTLSDLFDTSGAILVFHNQVC
jgi:hypothetical protein